MEYPSHFRSQTWLTDVNSEKRITDYLAQPGQRYRVIEEGTAHPSGPGLRFTRIALPTQGNSMVTERVFIVPSAALK
jgi:hypothetical protein